MFILHSDGFFWITKYAIFQVSDIFVSMVKYAIFQASVLSFSIPKHAIFQGLINQWYQGNKPGISLYKKWKSEYSYTFNFDCKIIL